MLRINGSPCFAMPRRRDATKIRAKLSTLRLCTDANANPEPVQTSVIATAPPLLVKRDRITHLKEKPS
jgi:hypothetical protein